MRLSLQKLVCWILGLIFLFPILGESSPEGQRVVREGIAVEFILDPAAERKEKSAEPQEGEDAIVRFKLTDTATGNAMTGLHPSAWMDLQRGDQAPGEKECQQKVQSFMQGSLSARPEIDLNTYYLLALNREPNISVIDPLLGFGSSKLYTLVLLKSPGEDWVLDRDKKRLFVAMPLANQVAVVDTATWKVVSYIDVGPKPNRLAFQPDERYLWVGHVGWGGAKAESGVTVIDTAGLKVAARIPTGAGYHEMAFAGDDRYAFVTNQETGTLSVIDVQTLTKVKDLPTGPRPVALAFSALSQAIYVLHEGEGSIVAVDGRSHKVLARMKARPGLRTIRFTPDGRWGFVVNAKESLVHIFDPSTHRILQAVPVGKRPDQISFTRSFAYIRSTGSEEVSMIPLGALGKAEAVPVTKFPGGQAPPERSSGMAVADAIVPTPEDHGVLVANSSDQMIYYYMEGMAAPMGSFQNYRREPRAILVMDRGLREAVPGVYSTRVRLTGGGKYDVAFLLDSPRILHCFELSVRPNPAVKRRDGQIGWKIESLFKERQIRVGEGVQLQFKLTDPATHQPRVGLKDVRVLMLLAPGIWQKRDWARSVGDGIYEVAFTAPKPGVYYLFFESRSLGVQFNQLPYLILQAAEEKVLSPARASEKTGEASP
ncbi:MAG: cytochrome D1 [Candidatus Tectomicrobia bacterium]|uniref:Cytochrome D1 n=1 Tax=Tectimicrobiota bacterium TaxID=2528274 RepID=A0A932FZE6_UNCTE|nr:cytochrome D1 [Candidatus Tectomicrobia bacterium]